MLYLETVSEKVSPISSLLSVKTLLKKWLTRLIFFNLGAFGNVKVGWMKGKNGKKYAIKTMKKAEIINSKHVDHIENEKNILERVNHPFAVSLRPFFIPF